MKKINNQYFTLLFIIIFIHNLKGQATDTISIMVLSNGSFQPDVKEQINIRIRFNSSDSILIHRYEWGAIEFKIPGKEWHTYDFYSKPEYHCENCFTLLDTVERNGLLSRIYIISSDTALINQLVYASVNIDIRYRLDVIKKGIPFSLYSNIDTLHLPVMSFDDAQVIKHILSKGWNPTSLVTRIISSDRYNDLIYVKENFSSSILSEYAKFWLLEYDFTTDNMESSLTAEKILWYKTQFQSFLNSASPDLRKFASWKLADPLFNQ